MSFKKLYQKNKYIKKLNKYIKTSFLVSLNSLYNKSKQLFEHSLKPALLVFLMLIFIAGQSTVLGAFEAHVINVKAKIISNTPKISPPDGKICAAGTGTPNQVTITAPASLMPDAEIVYTVTDSDPDPDCSLFVHHSSPTTFGITGPRTVRARTCYGDTQSSVVSLDITVIDCGGSYCGDGLITGNEECDDHNQENGDGCSSECKLESVCDPSKELISNGDFEEPLVGTPQKWDIFLSSVVPGWDVEWMPNVTSKYGGYDRPEEAYLEFHRGVNGWLPQSGDQYVELDTDWVGPGGALNNEPASVKIYQNIPTIPGENYHLTFYFSPRPGQSAQDNILGVRVGNVVSDDLPGGAGGSNTQWVEYTYDFVANSYSTLVKFGDLGTPNSLGTFLDNVSLRCAPPEEPDPVCGNEIKEKGEQCDDGNTEDGDGCSSICEVEKTPPPEEEVVDYCMKINEVYYDVDKQHGDDPEDEWIELYNACDYTVDLKKWALEDNSGKKEIINESHSIDPGGFVVIAANASMWNKYWLNIPTNAYKIALGGKKLFNGLANAGDHLILYDRSGNQIDEVGWGDDTDIWDPAVSGVSDGHSISRITKGVDTDSPADWMDTYDGSTPPGPNPGTNPHNSDGSLIAPNQSPSLSSQHKEDDTQPQGEDEDEEEEQDDEDKQGDEKEQESYESQDEDQPSLVEDSATKEEEGNNKDEDEEDEEDEEEEGGNDDNNNQDLENNNSQQENEE